MAMTKDDRLVCDGCGLLADSAHIAGRLQRLEWTTRFRPVHIQTLLLSGVSPQHEEEFLYAPGGDIQGEALRLLEVAGINPAGKSRESVLTEFQRAGFFLTHVLECPWSVQTETETTLTAAIEKRIPSVAARIRRSLRPRRVTLVTELLTPFKDSFSNERLECPVVLDVDRPFGLDGSDSAAAVVRLRDALAATPAVAR
jgi:hypothetical protein